MISRGMSAPSPRGDRAIWSEMGRFLRDRLPLRAMEFGGRPMTRAIARPLGSFLVALWAISTVALASAEGWTLAADEGGIRIWTKLEGSRPIKSYRTETIVDASIERVAEILLDFDHYAAWARAVSESRTIGRPSREGVLGYIRTDLPFPVADRDAVQRAILRRDSDGKVRIELRSVPDAIPAVSSVVRMVDADAVIELEPLPDGRTRIRQSGYSDPGGSVPSFIINFFIVDGPLQMIQDLRKRAADASS